MNKSWGLDLLAIGFVAGAIVGLLVNNQQDQGMWETALQVLAVAAWMAGAWLWAKYFLSPR